MYDNDFYSFEIVLNIIMYAAYKYSPEVYFFNTVLNPFLTKGSMLYENHKKKVEESLSAFISPEGIINGSELRENWFSIDKTDVFISHSHKDINRVKALAGWLYDTFNLTSFIDSCAWGYCDDLLRIIDDKYCYQKNKGTYDYNLRNYTTSHVHMMLSTALTETMNRSECVLFFNTPNSIVMSDELKLINNKETTKTTSPWIFYELTMISKLNRVIPDRSDYSLSHSATAKRDFINIQYNVTDFISEIPSIDDNLLIKWKNECDYYQHPLDVLYKLTG